MGYEAFGNPIQLPYPLPVAHTLTRERALRRVLSEPLADWRDWLLYARCPAGHRSGPLPVAALLAMPRAPDTLGRMLHRLRCRECGAAPEGAALRRAVDSTEWVVLRLPPGMDAEPTGEPGTVRVAWWRR